MLEQAIKDAGAEYLEAEDKLKDKDTKTNRKAIETRQRKFSKARQHLRTPESHPPTATAFIPTFLLLSSLKMPESVLLCRPDFVFYRELV